MTLTDLSCNSNCCLL